MLLQSYKQRMIQVIQSIQGSHIISQIRQIIPDRMIHELNGIKGKSEDKVLDHTFLISKMSRPSALKIENYVPFDLEIPPLEIYPCRKTRITNQRSIMKGLPWWHSR